MDRKMIEQEYEVVDGRIRSSGKFENEPVYAPYFYSAWMDGEGDEDEDGNVTFFVTEADIEQFPELISVAAVELFESDQGFVYTRPIAKS